MIVIHNNIILDILKEIEESTIEFNSRKIFIMKNLDSGYQLKDIIELSFIYVNKKLIGCKFDEAIELILTELVKNIYIL
jgi:methyltransferase-like protein